MTPKESPLRFGTRRLYTDLPYQVYRFMAYIMSKAQRDTITKEQVKEEWRRFLKTREGQAIIYKGRPLCTVFIKEMFAEEARHADYVRKPHICLNVRWRTFLNYLDDEAKKYLHDVMENGDAIVKLYNRILSNALFIRDVLMPLEPVYSLSKPLEDFKRLLRLIGDMYYMKATIEKLVSFKYRAKGKLQELVEIIKRDERGHARLLYIMHLMADLIHLYHLVDMADFIAAYALLRNIIETAIKACAYYEYGRLAEDLPLGRDLFMYAMYFYEHSLENYRDQKEPERRKEKKEKERVYSWKRWGEELQRRARFIRKLFHEKSEVTLEDIIEEFVKCKAKELRINADVIKDFLEQKNLLDTRLHELYRACSYVIHNITPLPFFSLLEAKFFKYFLNKVLTGIWKLIIAVFTTPEERSILLRRMEIGTIEKPPNIDPGYEQWCLRMAKQIDAKHKEVIDSILTNFLKELEKPVAQQRYDPLKISSLIYVINPSWTQLENRFFTMEDMEDLIRKLDPLCTPIGVLSLELNKSIEVLYESLYPLLRDEYKLDEEMARKVVFYITLMKLPRKICEMLKRGLKECRREDDHAQDGRGDIKEEL